MFEVIKPGSRQTVGTGGKNDAANTGNRKSLTDVTLHDRKWHISVASCLKISKIGYVVVGMFAQKELLTSL